MRLRGPVTSFLGMALAISGAICVLTPPTPLYGQSTTTGDIAGVVSDATGAVVPNAKIVVTNSDTGFTQTVTSGSNGGYRAPLLKPGVYRITVSASGFETSSNLVTVAIGQIASGDVHLTVGSSSVTVEVSSDTVSLLHTENADISTSISQAQVQSLPNPGNDLTFVAQVSPGAVMNTSGGDGNFSVFGLPATSNTFTLNGSYENDPFLNLSNSGATNLLLGNNEVSEVNVVSNAYGAQFGGLGGAQVNEITLSGTNKFHGNAVYQWNGRVLNANNYFRNQTPTLTPRSFDNVNQFAARIGGPIIRTACSSSSTTKVCVSCCHRPALCLRPIRRILPTRPCCTRHRPGVLQTAIQRLSERQGLFDGNTVPNRPECACLIPPRQETSRTSSCLPLEWT